MMGLFWFFMERKNKIIVVDYDSKWAEQFAELRDLQLGYEHIGDMGVTGREAFKRPPENILTDGTGRKWFGHHLYVCQTGSIGLRNHLALRDYLRQHPAKVAEYGNLKQHLAEKHPYDIDAYIEGKTDFITNILIEMGLNENDISTIRKDNGIS